MRNFPLSAGVLSAALVLLVGCGDSASSSKTAATNAPAAPAEPEAFLKWAMDRHAAAEGFHAKGTVGMTVSGQANPVVPTREVFFERPNRYKVISAIPSGPSIVAVSDGKTQTIYSTQGGRSMTSNAPASPSDPAAYITQPATGGSPLYNFFGGSANYAKMVDPKQKVEFGPDEKTPNGEPGRVVKFYEPNQYGHVQALISQKTGHIYRLQYDNEPLVKKIMDSPMIKQLRQQGAKELAKMKPGAQRDQLAKQLEEMNKPQTMLSTETYTDVDTGSKVAANTFDTKVPESVVAAAQEAEKPPLPIGQPAPDIEVAGMDGKPVKLSSLRGNVVLIDFWETWCGPCREGLPETNRWAKVGPAQGLQVMGISDETPEIISKFLKENKYTFPAYRDAGGKAAHAFALTGYPTTAIIDAKGNLSAYLVGLRDPSEIKAALVKAGLKENG